jgi:hypothetical protein
MIDAEKGGPARIDARFSITPIGSVEAEVAGLLGESLSELLSPFYPARICKKAHIGVTELFTNVLENVSDEGSGVELEISIDGERLSIDVANRATEEQYAVVRERLSEIAGAESAAKLLAGTLRQRRIRRAKGGLGLIRLVAENKFTLSATYEKGLLVMRAKYDLGEIA